MSFVIIIYYINNMYLNIIGIIIITLYIFLFNRDIIKSAQIWYMKNYLRHRITVKVINLLKKEKNNMKTHFITGIAGFIGSTPLLKEF